MEVKVEDMDGMSQEELVALEDKTVADDAEEKVEEVVKEPVETITPKAEEPPPVETVKVEDEPVPTPELEDDITKHISPPSKWAAQRQALRESKVVLAKAETMQTANDSLTAEVEWLKSQLTSKGADAALSPADLLSPEKIAAVREEHGDELADMFQAVSAIQGVKQPVVEPTPSKVEEPVKTSDTEMDDAISNNDELSYWQQKSPELWDRAVAMNDAYLKDPSYVKLSYEERFYHVVNKVKADVVEEAKSKAPKTPDPSGEPPNSLSGAGSSPTATEKSSVDKVLEATPEEQTKLYNSLSEAEREKVDVALGI